MLVEPKQKCDEEIIRLRREMLNRKFNADSEASESLTELDTDTEERFRKLGMGWVGSYLLDTEPPPLAVERGWTAGKGPMDKMPFDLLLCTRPFAKEYEINLRNPHARFNFLPETRSFYIIGGSRSSLAQLTVNGNPAARQPYHLNQHSMQVQFGKLEYCFQWTEYAAKAEFIEARSRYVTRKLGGLPTADIDYEMPTPLATKRTMGGWTLGEALDAGVRGRVFFASNSSGNVATIKLVERNARNCHSVAQEIQILREVTDLARQSDEGERVVHVVEVIYTNDEDFDSKTPFDNVGIVLQPMTPNTFVDLLGTRSMG